MAMADAYRSACRRHHRTIGNYLATVAWNSGVDCIVLERKHLERLLALKRFKSARIEWLLDDLSPWFPYKKAMYRTGAASSINSLWLSRKPLTRLPTRSMTTKKRLDSLPDDFPSSRTLTDAIGRTPSLEEIVSYLALLSDGLALPDARYEVVRLPKKGPKRRKPRKL